MADCERCQQLVRGNEGALMEIRRLRRLIDDLGGDWRESAWCEGQETLDLDGTK